MEDFNLNNVGEINRILLEKAPIGIGISFLDGTIIYANKTIQELIGFNNEEVKSLKSLQM